MTNETATTASPRIIDWTFGFGSDRLTCGVESDGRAFRLVLIANGRAEAAVVETFPSSAVALQRHAELAARLREHGWTVLAYTGQAPRVRTSYQPAA